MMLTTALSMLLLSSSVFSMPVKEAATQIPTAQSSSQQTKQQSQQLSSSTKDVMDRHSSKTSFRQRQDFNRKMFLQRKSRLGLKVREKLTEEFKIRRLPEYMRDMTPKQKLRERKRLFGLGATGSIPKGWSMVQNQVLVRAEQDRQRDPTLSIGESIRRAQRRFDEEMMMIPMKLPMEELAPGQASRRAPIEQGDAHPSTDRSTFKKDMSSSSTSSHALGTAAPSRSFDLNLAPADDEGI